MNYFGFVIQFLILLGFFSPLNLVFINLRFIKHELHVKLEVPSLFFPPSQSDFHFPDDKLSSICKPGLDPKVLNIYILHL